MLKPIAAFFVLVLLLLLAMVYFIGDFNLNFTYIKAQVLNEGLVDRTLIWDQGSRGNDNYSLKVSTTGIVEFQKQIGRNHDQRTFQITSTDVEKIQQKLGQSNAFNLFNLDRTYCFNKFDAKIYLDFGWVNKTIPYSNCNDDPVEIREFRNYIYEFLGVSL